MLKETCMVAKLTGVDGGLLGVTTQLNYGSQLFTPTLI